jgi:RNA 2',3'-cyclic 3'-phosphodiesterase
VTDAAPARLRLFFALWPDADVRASLSRYAQDAQALCGGRLMRPPNLHVTLAFIGDVPASRLDPIVAAATGVTPRRFVLDVDRVEYWRHNRIVWAGPSNTPRALAALVEELRAALDAAGVRYDRKPYVPHATLLRDARAAALPPFTPVSWPVEGFVLVKSVPGADYAIVREWRATAA